MAGTVAYFGQFHGSRVEWNLGTKLGEVVDDEEEMGETKK